MPKFALQEGKECLDQRISRPKLRTDWAPPGRESNVSDHGGPDGPVGPLVDSLGVGILPDRWLH